jgi:hypothetical protein
MYMTIFMNDSHIVSIAQIKEFIKVARDIEFQGASQQEKYQWIETALFRFRYFSLRKKEKSILKQYLIQMTGYSDAQLTRLIAQKKKTGRIIINNRARHRFSKVYTPEDTALLVKTDRAHERLSGPATKRVLEREYTIFGNERFKRLKNISSAHIYNLRDTRQYLSQAKFFVKTKPTKVNIGERRKPDPQGQPGFLRVDTMHQGDLEKEKGVYHINIVDTITQWEIVGAVERISEQYLTPLLEDILNQFPFRVLGFHSDNGSEFINRTIARLLNKLLIEQTKSRTRHCNDNALVEGKNGSIVRKQMGYIHIPQKYASVINQFYKKHLNIYLNFHRPCGFATIRIDRKGKEKKVYDVYRTPYEALKTHPMASEFLKEGISFEKLDKMAFEKSDNECGASMQKAKDKLFDKFNRHKPQLPTKFTTYISGSYVD